MLCIGKGRRLPLKARANGIILEMVGLTNHIGGVLIAIVTNL